MSNLDTGLEFDLPTEVLFGEGVSLRVGEYASDLGKKALIVTGRNSARSSGALDRILPSLESFGVEDHFFSEVEPNPTTATLTSGGRAARDIGADHIIAVGGGSPLDAAKGIAILATNEGPPERYFGEEPANEPLPLLAVPTTSGTGSEVTPYAVITDTSGGMSAKRTIRTPGIFPKAAFVDPELTYSMSPSITADTGMDALSHAVEGCLCRKRSRAADHMAMNAIGLVLRHLRQAFDSPQDADARSGMCMAALLAGVVIAQTGTELVHTMGYRLTLSFDVPHGRANAMVIPHVVRLYSPCDALGWMCKALGGKWVAHKKAGEFLAREIEELSRDVDIPTSLGEKVPDEDMTSWVRDVVSNERKMVNCCRRPTEKEVRSIFAKVIG